MPEDEWPTPLEALVGRFRAIALLGTRGRSLALKRQIILSNLMAMIGPLAAIPFQIFFVIHDLRLYAVLFTANLVFMVLYLCVPVLNNFDRYTTARNLGLASALGQIWLATYYLSTGAGTHLFYLSISSTLAMLFYRQQRGWILALVSFVSLLFVLCVILFPPGTTSAPVPLAVLRVMYIGCAVGTVGLTGLFAYLFRMEIERAEASLAMSNRRLERLTTTDQLTGLMNRRGMDASLAKAWTRMRREDGPLSLLMCDVDRFKAYNDQYGHPAGDEVLKRVADVLQRAARRPSDEVARYGGEEFVLVMPDTDAEAARVVAKRILDYVARLSIAHLQSDFGRVLTVSVGLSTAQPAQAGSADALLIAADLALYQAKENGRNRIADERIDAGISS